MTDHDYGSECRKDSRGFYVVWYGGGALGVEPTMTATRRGASLDDCIGMMQGEPPPLEDFRP